MEIYCQSNGFEIRFGIGGCCSFTFFTIFLIHDSNTYHGHGMTFRFDLCLLNVSCGDENKYECFTHYRFNNLLKKIVLLDLPHYSFLFL